MSVVKRVQLGGLVASLLRDVKLTGEETVDSLRATGQRTLAIVSSVTPVVTGNMKAGWRTESLPDGAQVVDPVPYAGIVDHHHGLVDGVMPEIEGAVADELKRRVGKRAR